MLQMSRRRFALAAALFGAVSALVSIEPVIAFEAKSTAAVNVTAKGLALRGHDPVAYFTQSKPTPGVATFQSTFGGATYQFATAENKAAFDAEPGKYAPQYGGFCAYAAALGYKADADPAAFDVVDGRLYVNYNLAVAKNWRANAANYIKAGDAKWLTVKNKLPK